MHEEKENREGRKGQNGGTKKAGKPRENKRGFDSILAKYVYRGQLKAGDIQGYISPSSLPPGPPSLMHQWVGSIKSGSVCSTNVYDGWNLVQLMEGCYTAGREGREVTF